jgi:hypothetical protein
VLNSSPLRRARLIPAALLVALSSAAAYSAPAAPAKPAFASGRVTYSLNGGMMKGTQVLMWAGGGKQFRQEMKGTASQGQQQMKIESWSIIDGGFAYSHASQMGNRVLRMKLPKDLQGGGMSGILGGAGVTGKVVGKGTAAGKACEIRQTPTGKVWVWQGLPLRAEVKLPGGQQMSMLATRVEPNVKLSPKLFSVPSGYQVVDQPMPGGAGGPGAPGAPRR